MAATESIPRVYAATGPAKVITRGVYLQISTDVVECYYIKVLCIMSSLCDVCYSFFLLFSCVHSKKRDGRVVKKLDEDSGDLVSILAISQFSCVTLGKLCNLSVRLARIC